MIEIVSAPPFATVQDLGFPSGRAWGLPKGGAMDPTRLASANSVVGNPPGAAGIEWTLGPLVVRVHRRMRLTILGAAELWLDEAKTTRSLDAMSPAFEAPARSILTIVPSPQLRFAYLAVAGGIAVPEVLSSRSTYLAGRLGGYEGRRLQSGDRLPIGPPVGRGFELTLTASASETVPDLLIRATRGPQWARFASVQRETFFSAFYTVSAAADRMGYRLDGPPVFPSTSATLPSEAVSVGAVQIPDGGQPIVVMPDGPTVGGYPKLAVVVQADLGMLAQCVSGRRVRFREVSLEQARACYSEVR